MAGLTGNKDTYEVASEGLRICEEKVGNKDICVDATGDALTQESAVETAGTCVDTTGLVQTYVYTAGSV